MLAITISSGCSHLDLLLTYVHPSLCIYIQVYCTYTCPMHKHLLSFNTCFYRNRILVVDKQEIKKKVVIIAALLKASNIF